MEITREIDGGLSFKEVPGAFYDQLAKLPDACDPKGSKELEERLFPHPISEEEPEEVRADIEEDWEEYVRPELEAANHASIATVLGDLNDAKVNHDDEGDAWYDFEISTEHTSSWFHALNLARLVLSHRYQLPFSEYPLEEDEKLSLPRLFAAHLCDRYAEIQEILISQMAQELS